MGDERRNASPYIPPWAAHGPLGHVHIQLATTSHTVTHYDNDTTTPPHAGWQQQMMGSYYDDHDRQLAQTMQVSGPLVCFFFYNFYVFLLTN
jgi:hypothetical protein